MIVSLPDETWEIIRDVLDGAVDAGLNHMEPADADTLTAAHKLINARLQEHKIMTVYADWKDTEGLAKSVTEACTAFGLIVVQPDIGTSDWYLLVTDAPLTEDQIKEFARPSREGDDGGQVE